MIVTFSGMLALPKNEAMKPVQCFLVWDGKIACQLTRNNAFDVRDQNLETTKYHGNITSVIFAASSLISVFCPLDSGSMAGAFLSMMRGRFTF